MGPPVVNPVAGVLGGYLGTWVEGLANPVL